MGNPFKEETGYLLSLTTKDIASFQNAERIATHLTSEKTTFEAHLKTFTQEDTSSFYAPIKKTKLNFFEQEKSSEITKEMMIKDDCQLFAKLFISCQNRECDLKEFFSHENQSFPASLSNGGKMHVCQKSQLSGILEKKVTLPDTEPVTDAIIIDGSALVNTLPPRKSKTFAEYAENEFIPRIKASANKYLRTDVVFDTYPASSLKSETRSRRGEGNRRRVTESGRLPRNWRSFLRHSENKTELFQFLADKVVESSFANRVIVTKGQNALSNHIDIDLSVFLPATTRKPIQEFSCMLQILSSRDSTL